jgi:hypothetical protein
MMSSEESPTDDATSARIMAVSDIRRATRGQASMWGAMWFATIAGVAVLRSTTAAKDFALGPAGAVLAVGAVVVAAIGQWPPRILVEKRMQVNDARRRSGRPHPVVLRPFNHRHSIAWGALIGVALGTIASIAALLFIRHR